MAEKRLGQTRCRVKRTDAVRKNAEEQQKRRNEELERLAEQVGAKQKLEQSSKRHAKRSKTACKERQARFQTDQADQSVWCLDASAKKP